MKEKKRKKNEAIDCKYSLPLCFSCDAFGCNPISCSLSQDQITIAEPNTTNDTMLYSFRVIKSRNKTNRLCKLKFAILTQSPFYLCIRDLYGGSIV